MCQALYAQSKEIITSLLEQLSRAVLFDTCNIDIVQVPSVSEGSSIATLDVIAVVNDFDAKRLAECETELEKDQQVAAAHVSEVTDVCSSWAASRQRQKCYAPSSS